MIGTINLAQPHPLHAHPRDIEALLTPFTRGSCVRRAFLHSLQMPLQNIQERSSRRVSLLSFSPPEQRLVGKSQPRLHQQVHIPCDTRKVSLNLDQPQAFGSERKGGSLKRLTFVSVVKIEISRTSERRCRPLLLGLTKVCITAH